jgi:hypothetical protein
MTWEEKGIAIARHNGTGKKINLQVNTWGCVYWTHLENVRLNKTPPPSNFWKKKINGWRQQKKAERIETGERIECEFRMKTANGVAVNFYLKLVEFNIRQKSRRIRSKLLKLDEMSSNMTRLCRTAVKRPLDRSQVVALTDG